MTRLSNPGLVLPVRPSPLHPPGSWGYPQPGMGLVSTSGSAQGMHVILFPNGLWLLGPPGTEKNIECTRESQTFQSQRECPSIHPPPTNHHPSLLFRMSCVNSYLGIRLTTEPCHSFLFSGGRYYAVNIHGDYLYSVYSGYQVHLHPSTYLIFSAIMSYILLPSFLQVSKLNLREGQ